MIVQLSKSYKGHENIQVVYYYPAFLPLSLGASFQPTFFICYFSTQDHLQVDRKVAKYAYSAPLHLGGLLKLNKPLPYLWYFTLFSIGGPGVLSNTSNWARPPLTCMSLTKVHQCSKEDHDSKRVWKMQEKGVRWRFSKICSHMKIVMYVIKCDCM